ncbi:bifunctional 4-hydroxy-2-oxoglutarate aldolase/2-dehydro-3-deoxy-phosphogluconate aldolase [Spiroplasma endosymbiont of Aspidapion aeneum]|uniref:bifunctional 4-hydroxy-2-oxoglutarate aldolase/2-dehydro-3-deoxy-phosphogluconate aldolase n=1 Tax=Spiroplasma endosymbiont of Aspidapion aeneum TaxID=3066276 RepID=UPI00313D8C67
MKNIIEHLINEKIVAVLRLSTQEKASKSIDAVIEAGFKFIEITLTIPNAYDIISNKLTKYKNSDVIIGAGTVTSIEQAKKVIELGCKYIVAPDFNLDISNYAKDLNIVYIPGVMTINEIVNVMNHGWEIVKLFPGNNYTPGFIKSVLAPFPNFKIMVTGGVDINNLNDWLNAGSVAVGIGGNLTIDIEKDNNYNNCVKIAKQFISKVNQ